MVCNEDEAYVICVGPSKVETMEGAMTRGERRGDRGQGAERRVVVVVTEDRGQGIGDCLSPPLWV